MSFDTDFAEFIKEYQTITQIGDYVDGLWESVETEGIINAVIQPYSETSINSNPIQIDRSLEGIKNKGTIFIMTSTEIEFGTDKRVFIIYKNKKYEIDQSMPYESVYEHYEYLACIVESDKN